MADPLLYTGPMDNSFVKLRKSAIALGVTALLIPGAAAAQTNSQAKLDESLRESVERGCVGTQSVIVRTKPGYRQGLRDSLAAHGDLVRGEFPALDAVAAEVHCDDLTTIASFDSTDSVSINAKVGVQALGLTSLLSSTVTTVVSGAQAAVTTARTALLDAKAKLLAAQKAVRAAEHVLAQANAQVAAARRALTSAKRSGYSSAIAAAEAKLFQADTVADAAEASLDRARTEAALAQATALGAQDDLVEAQEGLAAARTAAANREREGIAARDLKRKFFATMPVRASQISTDDELDSETGDYSSYYGFSTTSGGSGIGVAVIDSGIEAGTDFDGRITAFYDFTYGDIRAVAPLDPYGHGTHVAGLIASEFVGVAPNARLIGLRVLNEKGQGTTANVLRAIEFAIANKSLLGINVLNLSLGHPIYEAAATDPLVQAVEHAARQGLTVVVSAGNFGLNRKTGLPGYAGISSPGNAPSALTVGAVRTFNTATRDDDRIAPYSSRGPSWYDGFAKPDVSAPGDNLLSVAAANSVLRIAQEKRGNKGNYMRLSGTSMAAGVTSGVVALVLNANRGIDAEYGQGRARVHVDSCARRSREELRCTVAGRRPDRGGGRGRMARTINPQAPMGSPWLSSSLTPSTVIANKSYAWSQSIIWGARRVTGAQVDDGAAAGLCPQHHLGRRAWSEDDNIVWGNNFGDDDNIVWGNSFDLDDNIVWGNNIVWDNDDDNIVWGNLDDDNIVWGNLSMTTTSCGATTSSGATALSGCCSTTTTSCGATWTTTTSSGGISSTTTTSSGATSSTTTTSSGGTAFWRMTTTSCGATPRSSAACSDGAEVSSPVRRPTSARVERSFARKGCANGHANGSHRDSRHADRAQHHIGGDDGQLGLEEGSAGSAGRGNHAARAAGK